MGRAGLAQQTVETLGVLGVHQHIHGDLLTNLREGAAHFQVTQVRTHQHLPALATQLTAQLRRVVDLDLLQAQLAVPHVQLVEQRIGEGHELGKDCAVARQQVIAPAPLRQPLLVLPGAVACGAAEQEEVKDDAVEQRAQ